MTEIKRTKNYIPVNEKIKKKKTTTLKQYYVKRNGPKSKSKIYNQKGGQILISFKKNSPERFNDA